MQTVKRMKPLHCHPCTEPISLLTGNLCFNEWSLWLISSKVWVYRSMHAHCWIARIQAQRAKKEEMHNKHHVFKSYIRQCDKNGVISAFRRLISLFKYSAEAEERICDARGWGEGGRWCGGSVELLRVWYRVQWWRREDTADSFSCSFFLQPLASSLKQMGVEWEEDGG